MCGIVGIVTHRSINDSDNGIISIRHRGPDSSGSILNVIDNTNVFIGHTRLSILDLSPAGHQPMTSRDGRWILSYNGEIYNHNEIRKNLCGEFRGHSDTETLLEAIAKWGIAKTLPMLNGMFGFAAFDKQERKLYLVRDPFGIKPVYYARANREICFSSEIRGIMALGFDTGKINHESLNKFLSLRYVPSPDTLFNGVRRLHPGHVLCYDIEKDSLKLSCYIRPTKDRFVGSVNDAVAEYTEIMKNAVRNQLLSDVPVGVLLSGGIDSSLIASMAAETGKKIPCFTVGFGSEYKDCEIDDAAHTAKILGLEHEYVQVNSDDLWSVFPEVVKAVEEPLGTTSILPMWFLVKKAREYVTVVLTGQGNDEPWGGYRRYQIEMIRKYIPFSSRFKYPSSIINNYFVLPDYMERGMRCLPLADITERFEAAYSLFTPEEIFELTGQNSRSSLKDIEYWLDWISKSPMHNAEKMMGIDTRMNLADDLLLYGDKTSMAVSLEARVPMLDINVVRFVESLPLSYKIGIKQTKIVHKKAAEKYLPKQIVNRPKKGFQVPFGQWARSNWKDRIEAVLLAENASYLSYIDYDTVKRIWNEHVTGKRDRSRQLFALLTFAFCMGGHI